jgi:hypothetical protein
VHIKYAKDPIGASEMALQKSKSSSRPPDKARNATKSSRPVHSAPRLTDKNQAGAFEPLGRNKLLLRHQPSDGLDRARVLERAQPVMLGGAAYLGLARCLTGEHPELMELAAPGALSFLEEMCPKDALERLALTQTLLAHARAAYLTKVLTSQTEAAALGIVSDACDRAASTIARLMRAIAEYRQPKSPTTTPRERSRTTSTNCHFCQSMHFF